MKKNKGITLIALVITIIILLILAGVAISQLNNAGLFGKIQIAKEKQNAADALEKERLAGYETSINEYVNGDRGTVTLTAEQYKNITDRLTALETKVNTQSSGSIVTAYTATSSADTISLGSYNITDYDLLLFEMKHTNGNTMTSCYYVGALNIGTARIYVNDESYYGSYTITSNNTLQKNGISSGFYISAVHLIKL